MKKIVFLDRDGTINKEKDYLYKWSDFEFENGVIEGLKILSKLGYEFIIVTNQSGIARGYYSETDLKILNEKMLDVLIKNDIKILDVFYCPHHPEKGIGKYKIECSCRKPEIGMIEKAKQKYQIDINNSFMIGDKISDLICAEKSGLIPILVLTGYGEKTKKELKEKNIKLKYKTADNLLEVVKLIKRLGK